MTRTIFENLLNRSFPQVRPHCDLRHSYLVLKSGSALTCISLDHVTHRQQPHTCNGSHVSGCVWPVATTQRLRDAARGAQHDRPGSIPEHTRNKRSPECLTRRLASDDGDGKADRTHGTRWGRTGKRPAVTVALSDFGSLRFSERNARRRVGPDMGGKRKRYAPPCRKRGAAQTGGRGDPFAGRGIRRTEYATACRNA